MVMYESDSLGVSKYVPQAVCSEDHEYRPVFLHAECPHVWLGADNVILLEYRVAEGPGCSEDAIHPPDTEVCHEPTGLLDPLLFIRLKIQNKTSYFIPHQSISRFHTCQAENTGDYVFLNFEK